MVRYGDTLHASSSGFLDDRFCDSGEFEKVWCHMALIVIVLPAHQHISSCQRLALCAGHRLARGRALHTRRRNTQRRRRYKAVKHRHVPYKHLLVSAPTARKQVRSMRRRLHNG